QPQLYGRQIEGGRRHDRRAAGGDGAGGLRLGDTRPRPCAVVRLLRHPALLSAGAMDRALVSHRAPAAHLALRLSAGNLVGEGRQGMILGEADHTASGVTLDALFRRAGVRNAHARALIDPPNRASFTDAAPRMLTYAQADRAISALAATLRGLGLHTDTVVGLQLPSTVESVVAFLGVLRAGMIAAPLPLLWRQQDMVEALGRAGAKAIVTAGRIGACAHAEVAMEVAAELFPIRQICAFGDNLPDGV